MDILKYPVLYKMGAHIDTDLITPGKYLTSYEPEYLASICLKDAYPDFRKKMAPGGALVAGINFGCGSSRETAPIALKACGVRVILAEEFSRIFYRNAWNIGMPCIICQGISQAAEEGDRLYISLQEGIVRNESKGTELSCPSVPPVLMEICSAGGLIEYLKEGGGNAL